MPNLTLPPDQAPLALLTLALQTTLVETLKAVAQKNGNAPGPWLDEIENAALAAVKTTEIEGPGLTDQAATLRAAADYIRMLFTDVRTAIGERQHRDAGA